MKTFLSRAYGPVESVDLWSAGAFENASVAPRQAPSVSDAQCRVEVALVFALVMAAVWTPQGPLNSAVCLLTAFYLVWFSVRGRFSARELGLSQPGSGLSVTLAGGILIVAAAFVAAPWIRTFGDPHPVPLDRAWQYAVWALVQEFILQSCFFLRLEKLLGGRRAVPVAAVLFAIPHIPSPILTGASLMGGLLFCELFRRYRNLFPVGLVHAALGLTLAATLPERLLHHMRVGIGYLMFHP